MRSEFEFFNRLNPFLGKGTIAIGLEDLGFWFRGFLEKCGYLCGARSADSTRGRL